MITSTTELTERELSDAELALISGAGSSDQPSQTFDFSGVDHVSFSVKPDGTLEEQVFFSQPTGS